MKPIFPQSSVGAAWWPSARTDDDAPTELADFLGGCSTNMPRLWRWFAADRPANPAAGFAKDAARVSPSPCIFLIVLLGRLAKASQAGAVFRPAGRKTAACAETSSPSIRLGVMRSPAC